jgi:hypothetical protein
MWEIVIATTIMMAPLQPMPDIPVSPSSNEILNCSKADYYQTHVSSCAEFGKPAPRRIGTGGNGSSGGRGGLLGLGIGPL